MKYALISDIHANLPALEAVLADIDGRGDVDAIYHLGELGGYAPWPNEVAALMRARNIGDRRQLRFHSGHRLRPLRLQG